VIETLEMADAENPFFENWMVTWSRKIFIAKVLGYVTPKTSAPELRNRLRYLQSEMGRGFNRGIDPAAGRPELEEALLAIEQVPRCALLLNVFEKLAIDDIGILLNLDRESVKTATAIGLIELTRNLAGSREPRTSIPVVTLCGSAGGIIDPDGIATSMAPDLPRYQFY
jgi:hypothetical protein